jgi:hypothetical protein
MGLLDGFEPIVPILSCKTRTVLESLDKDDRKILEAALADREKWSNYGLSKALAERNIIIKGDTLGIHRRGECSCLRT